MNTRFRYALAAAAFAGAAALARVGAPLWGRGPEGRPAPAAARPATRPTPYPPPALIAACRSAARDLERRLDASFSITVSPPFIVAGNCPAAQLRGYTTWSVVRPAKAMWTAYFGRKPTRPITILLFADARSYAHWAKRLFNDTDLPHFGYCRRDGTMVMNIATGTGTLVHELTHALIAYDFPTVPTWFNEGLASLHEQCIVREDVIVGDTNWRLPALQDALRAGRLRPLRELVTARDFYGRFQGLNYAQGRYFVMYMQQRGVLRKFYAHFRKLHADAAAARAEALRGASTVPPAAGDEDRLDVRAIEDVLGADIDTIDKRVRAWVMTLKFR